LHHPAIVGLFVVFACNAPVTAKFASYKAGHVCEPLVRYYPAPRDERRHKLSYDGGLRAARLVPTRIADFLPGAAIGWRVGETFFSIAHSPLLETLPASVPAGADTVSVSPGVYEVERCRIDCPWDETVNARMGMQCAVIRRSA